MVVGALGHGMMRINISWMSIGLDGASEMVPWLKQLRRGEIDDERWVF